MEKQGRRSWRIDEDEGLVTQKEKWMVKSEVSSGP